MMKLSELSWSFSNVVQGDDHVHKGERKAGNALRLSLTTKTLINFTSDQCCNLVDAQDIIVPIADYI